MKLQELRKIIQEELKLALDSRQTEQPLSEKSVPEPYDRKRRTKLSKSQIEKRKKIGTSMMGKEKTVDKFRKKYGQDWKDYIWAAASSAVKNSKK